MRVSGARPSPGLALARGVVAVPRYAWPAGAATIAALICVPVEYGNTGSVGEAAQALAAIAIAFAVACLAFSLPGITPSGLAIGGFFVTAGATSWTYGKGVWGPLLVGGVALLIWMKAWSQPWLRFARPMARLGGAWLGLAYWFLGMFGAVFAGRPGIAVQRLLYAGVFALAVAAVIDRVTSRRRLNRTGPDLTVGIAAAFLIMIAILLVAGAGNLFDPTHVVVEGPWGDSQKRRFWGGSWLLYHPNSLAGIATFAGIRIGFDQAFRHWQRLSATAVAGYVVFVTNSRTGFLVLVVAALLHAALLWWERRQGSRLHRWLGPREFSGLAKYPGRQVVVAALVPFIAVALVLVASGGKGFVLKNRYDSGGISSGRTATWAAVGSQWRDAGLSEKLLGDAQTVRAVVRRASAPGVDLTTDNAAVGALRRGGVAGVLAFLLGLWLLVRHALRRRVPAWFFGLVAAALPTIAVADWLLGGTGGTIWILLLTGEAWLVLGQRSATPAAGG